MSDFFNINIPVSWVCGELVIEGHPYRGSEEFRLTIDNTEAQLLIDELKTILATRTKEPRKPKHESVDIKEFISDE